jgi:Fe-Mn family superoxide dismutase
MYEAAAVPSPTETGGRFVLTALPYAEDALAPVISRETVALHYDKHHRAYVDKLNQLVAGTDFARMPIDEIVKRTAAVPARAEIFNNAGQAWNHHFYWRSLAPAGGRPGEELRRRLDRDLGGYDAFAEAFTKAAVAQFGSGWAWLVLDDGELKIMTTANGDSPMARGITSLLAVDVWEHAYYLDYKNERGEHVRQVVDRLINWEFAAQNLAAGEMDARPGRAARAARKVAQR